VRVLIGEDEALLREGLSLVLVHGGFDVVGTARSGAALVAASDELRPDLVITDIRMPPGRTDDGLRAALKIRATWPDLAIVVLSQHLQRRYARELLDAPTAGTGYLLKQRISDIDTFCADLRRVCAGETVLDPEVVALMLSQARSEHDALHRLTPRQHEVLTLMAEGRSNAFIAHALSVTEKAVVQHVSHIYSELDLPPSEDDHRRVLAVTRYLGR
jgi:DNA-binding NarL/FixJ family response regulator